jgi:ribonuclease VapC
LSSTTSSAPRLGASWTVVEQARIEIEPITEEQVRIARQAYVDYGRGNHPAGLNFGDCFAYALAKAAGEPLLSKGEDFARTDIRPYRSAGSEP